jgi:lycopene cyclase domain-containing protein
MRFYSKFKSFFLSIFIIALIFLVWDEWFTQISVWGFNKNYLTGIFIGHLPLEEVLFFICIPFASLFIHYSLLYFFPNFHLGSKTVNSVRIVLILIVGLGVLSNFFSFYTSINGLSFLGLMILSFYLKNDYLNRFFISFLIILIPFFIVNGVLTGSFIQEPVVWYNNSENLGFRVFTIPAEDAFYAFNMLYPVLLLTEYFEKRLG